jgi:hypothetical protein
MGYAGATEPVELLWLALHSRSLERPINVAVRGASASGKTFAIETAMRFHPPRAVHDLTAASERSLAYTNFNTEHAYVLIGEASALHRDGIGASIIRSICWGSGIKYETVQKTPIGLQAVVIEHKGPTGLITSSVRDLEDEISTRVLAVHVDESPEQTRAIVREHARADSGEAGREVDTSAWVAASEWLAAAGTWEVVVPFATEIAEALPVEDVRIRRDYSQLLSLIKIHAQVHQWRRAREEDGRIVPTGVPTESTAVTFDLDPPRGRVVAEEDDYRAAYRLLGTVLAVTLDDVSDVTRETVQAVAELLPQHSGGVSYQVLGDHLGITRQAATKRARTALKAGFLANREDRRGYPARLELGDAVPAARPVLPDPDQLFQRETRQTPDSGGAPLRPQRNALAANEIDAQLDLQPAGNRQQDQQPPRNSQAAWSITLNDKDLGPSEQPATPFCKGESRLLVDDSVHRTDDDGGHVGWEEEVP